MECASGKARTNSLSVFLSEEFFWSKCAIPSQLCMSIPWQNCPCCTIQRLIFLCIWACFAIEQWDKTDIAVVSTTKRRTVKYTFQYFIGYFFVFGFDFHMDCLDALSVVGRCRLFIINLFSSIIRDSL